MDWQVYVCCTLTIPGIREVLEEILHPQEMSVQEDDVGALVAVICAAQVGPPFFMGKRFGHPSLKSFCYIV